MLEVAVTVIGAAPAVYELVRPLMVIVGADSVWGAPVAAIEVSVHVGPVYAPAPLASATEVVYNPVTGAADLGDAGPWMSTVAAVAKVAVNPGGRVPVPHSIAVNETATVVNP
jgi:hypothetical protein